MCITNFMDMGITLRLITSLYASISNNCHLAPLSICFPDRVLRLLLLAY